MKNRDIILVLLLVGFFTSCNDKESGLRSADIGDEEGDFLITRDGNKFIEISQYANGSRVRLVAGDGSEIIISLDQDLNNVKEVFAIKSLAELTESENLKKYISINENFEVEVSEK